MVLALDAIMDFAAEIELADRGRLIGDAMSPQCFFSDLANTDAFHA